jgi:plasmid stabilization system protein ParE
VNRDRVAIFDYIEADERRAAARIDDRLLAAAALIGQFPELGRSGRIMGTHEFAVPATPYLVVYKVAVNSVLILRLRHGAQQTP